MFRLDGAKQRLELLRRIAANAVRPGNGRMEAQFAGYIEDHSGLQAEIRQLEFDIDCAEREFDQFMASLGAGDVAPVTMPPFVGSGGVLV